MSTFIKSNMKNPIQQNDRKEPRILMLVEKCPPAYSGAGQQAYHLSKTLTNLGCQISVVTQHHKSLPQKSTQDGISIYRLQSMGGRILYSYLFGIKAALWLLRYPDQYDILHIHGINLWALFAMLVARLTGKRIVAKMTSLGKDDPLGLEQMTFGRIRKNVYLFPHKIIAISQAMADQYMKSNFKTTKLLQIPNGVDLNKFFPVEKIQKIKLRQKLALPLTKKIVLFVGNICYLKGVGLLIDTWANYLKNEDIILCLVGPDVIQDSFSKNIRNKIVQEKLEDRIILTGQCNNVAEYMQAADLFVLPSKREGLPNALLEAMACGLPSILYNIPAVKNIFDKDPPVLLMIKKFKSDKMADAVLKLLFSEEGKRMGKLAHDFILQKFSIEAIAQMYIKLYKELHKKFNS
jgi:glycosyltransferase involved in cell wall biosynthesis